METITQNQMIVWFSILLIVIYLHGFPLTVVAYHTFPISIYMCLQIQNSQNRYNLQNEKSDVSISCTNISTHIFHIYNPCL